MPDQWEYKTIGGGRWRQMLRAAGSDCYRPNEFEVQDELLNGLGREGWEVCAYTRCVFPFAVMIVLKRRIGAA